MADASIMPIPSTSGLPEQLADTRATGREPLLTEVQRESLVGDLIETFERGCAQLGGDHRVVIIGQLRAELLQVLEDAVNASFSRQSQARVAARSAAPR